MFVLAWSVLNLICAVWTFVLPAAWAMLSCFCPVVTAFCAVVTFCWAWLIAAASCCALTAVGPDRACARFACAPASVA